MLILIVLGIGVAFVLLIALGMGINSTIDLFSREGDPAGQMISAFAFGFEAVLLLICSWFVLQKTLGREQAEVPFKFSFTSRQIIVVIGMVIAFVVIGGVVAYADITWLAWIVLPVLTVLVIAPPLMLLFRIGTKGIELGPRWRIFGALGLSLTLGPLIMVVLEFVLLLGIVIFGAAIIAIRQPDLLKEIISLVRVIKQETNEEAILKLLAPYISNPFMLATLIGYVAFMVPLIEELFKPLAVWVFAKKLESPAQGFAMGLVGGAAFALIESLNASGDGSSSWPVIVSIRTMTSLLHITASGLVGWGIVSAFQEKRTLRFFAAYFTAAAMHGLWNACAVGAGLSTVGEVIGKPEWLFNIFPAVFIGMLGLGGGMLSVLIASNAKLQNSPSPEVRVGDEGVQ